MSDKNDFEATSLLPTYTLDEDKNNNNNNNNNHVVNEQSEHVHKKALPTYEDLQQRQPAPSIVLIDVNSVEAGKPAPSHFWKNAFSFLCCFWPTGLMGLYYSVRTRQANMRGDYASASYFSRTAKWVGVTSIVFGSILVMIVGLVHMGIVAKALNELSKEFVHSYNSGFVSGNASGHDVALKVIADNMHTNTHNSLPLTFANFAPTPVGNANIYDMNDKFWSSSFTGKADYLGQQFGVMDGFRYGFCSTEGTACTPAEKSHSLKWFMEKCHEMCRHHHRHYNGHNGHNGHKGHNHKFMLVDGSTLHSNAAAANTIVGEQETKIHPIEMIGTKVEPAQHDEDGFWKHMKHIFKAKFGLGGKKYHQHENKHDHHKKKQLWVAYKQHIKDNNKQEWMMPMLSTTNSEAIAAKSFYANNANHNYYGHNGNGNHNGLNGGVFVKEPKKIVQDIEKFLHGLKQLSTPGVKIAPLPPVKHYPIFNPVFGPVGKHHKTNDKNVAVTLPIRFDEIMQKHNHDQEPPLAVFL